MRGEEVTAATTVERYYLYQGAGRPRLTDWLDVQYSIVGWQIWPIRSGHIGRIGVTEDQHADSWACREGMSMAQFSV